MLTDRQKYVEVLHYWFSVHIAAGLSCLNLSCHFFVVAMIGNSVVLLPPHFYGLVMPHFKYLDM